MGMDQVSQPQQSTVIGVAATPGNVNVDQGHHLQLANQLMEHLPINQHHQQLLEEFWAHQAQEVEQATDFTNHSLPLAYIEKVVEADECVRMISADLPVILAKACKMFILELTLRSWIHAEENKRRTLLKNDVVGAIERTNILGFLRDIDFPDDLQDEEEEEGLDIAGAAMPAVGAPPQASQ